MKEQGGGRAMNRIDLPNCIFAINYMALAVMVEAMTALIRAADPGRPTR